MVASESPQPVGAGFGLGGHVTQFIGDLESTVDFMLRRVVGSFGPFGKIGRPLEPERQFMFNPMRCVVQVPASHCSTDANYKMVAS